MAGAFWRIGYAQQSTIDSVLEKENFTLEELLDDDDILQECREANKKLTEYLAQPVVIEKLLKYVVNEPSDDVDEKERFKYPNVASEVLTSECWPIMDAICRPEALELLWGTLDKPQPLNPLLASLFTKVIIMLLGKEVEMTTKYIMTRPEIIDKLISHLATPAIMDVILKMTMVEAAGDEDEGSTLMTYLADDSKLVSILVGLFDTSNSGASDAVIANAAFLIEDLVMNGRKEAIEMQEFSNPSPFILQLISVDKISALLKHIFNPNTSRAAMQSGLDIISMMLSEPDRGEDEAPPTEMDIARHKLEMDKVLEALGPFVKNIYELLLVEPSPVLTADGPVKVPIGSVRLNAARSIEALVTANNDDIDAQLIELKAIQKLFDLYPQYPNNNFLHAYVGNIVSHIVSTPPNGEKKSLLHQHLFVDNDILTRVTTLYKSAVAPTSDPSVNKARLGYAGHVIRMANKISEVSVKTADLLKTYFPSDVEEKAVVFASWNSFVNNELQAANTRSSSTYTERPSMQSFDSDDDDDDEIYGGGEMAHSAQLRFGQYLNEKISIDIPDDYGIDDDDDDDDASDLMDEYGRSGVFSNSLSYSTDVPVVPSSLQWQIVDGNGHTLGKPPANATVTLSSIETSSNSASVDTKAPAKVDPLVIENGATVEPEATSTPVDAAWANFDSVPQQSSTTTGWADFDKPPKEDEKPQRQNTPAYHGAGTFFEPGIGIVEKPGVSTIGEQDELGADNGSSDDDEELPTLPADAEELVEDEGVKAAINAVLKLTGGEETEESSSSDPAPPNVVQDIEGGGNLFSSAV